MLMDIASTKKTNLHVDPRLWRALRMRAYEEGITATTALNRAIAAYLERSSGKGKPKGG
jgi:hypothetical protein